MHRIILKNIWNTCNCQYICIISNIVNIIVTKLFYKLQYGNIIIYNIKITFKVFIWHISINIVLWSFSFPSNIGYWLHKCQINLNKSPNAKQLLKYNNSIENKLSNKMKLMGSTLKMFFFSYYINTNIVYTVLMIHFSSRLDINVRTSAKIYSDQVVFIAQIDSVC
jgi:hypothetical protein